MKNKRLEILIIAFISLKLFVFQWVSPDPFLRVAQAGNIGAFGLSNYAANFGNNPTGNIDKYGHKLFINTGDANFYMADITANVPNPPITPPIGHSYTTGSFKPYAELTGIYKDKDDPPKRINTNIPNGVMDVPGTSANPIELSQIDLSGSKMKFTPVRRIVPNNEYSIILSVESKLFDNCNFIEILYDRQVFSVRDLVSYKTPYYTLDSPEAGKVKIKKISNGDGRAYPYHITLPFITNSSISSDFTVSPFISNAYNPVEDLIGTETFDDQNALRVVNSHDPNNKLFIPNYFTDLNGNVEVLINFQNEGDGPTTNVVIEDELDVAMPPNMIASDLDDISISLKLQAPAGNQVQPNFSYANGKIRVELCSLKLNGKKEKDGNGFFYPESATMGSISYVLPKKLFSGIKPCHSVVNSAQIFFDCNPPISTDLAYLTRIEANSSNLGSVRSSPNSNNKKGNNKDIGSSKKKISQDTTKQWPYVDVDSICPRQEVYYKEVIKNADQLSNFNSSTTIDGLDISGASAYRWYPAKSLQASNVRMLDFKQGNRLLKQNFAFLVSKAGVETVVHVPVDMCNMTLTYKWIKGKYTVSVVDPNMLPADQLVWNVACILCNGDSLTQAGASRSRNGQTVTIEDPVGDSRLITVYNPATGCSAEVMVPPHNSIDRMNWWRWAQILMGVSIFVFLIWSLFGKKKSETNSDK